MVWSKVLEWVGGPVLSGPVEPPSGSGFGVNTGPADPFPPRGTQTPGLPTFHFYFPGCKTPLAIRAGVALFYLLIKCVLEILKQS